jgi:hypothetical protein
MKRYHDTLLVPLALLLAPYLIVAWSWGPAVPLPSRSTPAQGDGQPLRHPEFDRADESPRMHAIDPEEARQRMLLYVELHRPPMQKREAVLPNPSDGRELVDRFLVSGAGATWDNAVSQVTGHLPPPLRSQWVGRPV